MRNPIICTVVTGKKLNEFLINLKNVQTHADCIEIRVDYILDFSKKMIATLKKQMTKPCIFTCRKKQEGGFFQGTETQRMEIVMEAIKQNFEYVDIELSSIKNVQIPKKSKTKIICSYHNFLKTPSQETLESIINQMHTHRIDIIKIATFVHTNKDIKTLLHILINKNEDDKMIVIGMGEKGKITRVINPLLGSYLTFASNKNSQSAPGQINVQSMRQIYKLLN